MLSALVAASVTYFDPQPAPGDLPPRMPSPFAPGNPHPIAAWAASRLRTELLTGLSDELGLDRDGKMFGVLVVRDAEGRIGFLKAFSGMVGRSWELPGFCEPTFDPVARDAFWIAGEAELVKLAERIEFYERQCEPLRAELAALRARHLADREALRATHQANKAARHERRAAGLERAELAALERASNADRAERRALEDAQRFFQDEIIAKLSVFENDRDTSMALRTAKSRDFLVRIHRTYALANAAGKVVGLRELFEPAEPPGGAGDCAAPKLLATAYREGLTPIALAEFWCGAPPPTGDRRDGAFYPACRSKCRPILGHMLRGLDVEPAPDFLGDVIGPDEPHTLYEDQWLAVIAKPAGLLSVPARSSKADSVLARLRTRYPDATGPLLPHRLDLDTSGLMLVAKDQDTHGALQRQFEERTITKRYIAVLDGEPHAESGTVELPLRVDLDDRPRQIVDPVHGKPAVTTWQVLARQDGRTRVALWPKTGRSHQLRVHAAHPDGIGVPIVGDPLYGLPGDRLLLHAEAIEFVHPHTQERLSFEHAAPF